MWLWKGRCRGRRCSRRWRQLYHTCDQFAVESKDWVAELGELLGLCGDDLVSNEEWGEKTLEVSVDACGEDVKDHVTDYVGVMLGWYDAREVWDGGSGDGRHKSYKVCVAVRKFKLLIYILIFFSHQVSHLTKLEVSVVCVKILNVKVENKYSLEVRLCLLDWCG